MFHAAKLVTEVDAINEGGWRVTGGYLLKKRKSARHSHTEGCTVVRAEIQQNGKLQMTLSCGQLISTRRCLRDICRVLSNEMEIYERCPTERFFDYAIQLSRDPTA